MILITRGPILLETDTWFFEVYESFRTRSVWPEIGRIAKTLVAVALVQAAAIFFLRLAEDVSRLFFGTYFVIAFALLVGNRAILRQVARSVRRSGLNTRVFAVVGSGDLAHDVVATVADHPEWGLQFAGHVALDEDGRNGAPSEFLLGTVSQLGRILDDNVIDEVIFALPRERLSSVEGAFRLCQELGAGARVCLDLFEVSGARVAPGGLDGLPMLSFFSAPTDEVALLFKHAFDVISSAAALLLFSPLLLATAVAIKLESPGPVFKMRNDPRVTRVGRFIRRTSIDELPQFLNVLAGEKSVVGPRPPVPAAVRQYQRWQWRRLSVKPGITCTWQVSGRSNISFDEWMALDLEYIDTWTLWRDVQICFQTIPAVLTSRGAH